MARVGAAERLTGALELRRNDATVRWQAEPAIRPAVAVSLRFHEGALLADRRAEVPEYSNDATTLDIAGLAVDGDDLRITAHLTIDDDPWVVGGSGVYRIVLSVGDGLGG